MSRLRFRIWDWRLEGRGNEDLTGHIRFAAVKIEHHWIQNRERRKPANGVAQKELADPAAALGVQEMGDWFAARAKARLREHAYDALLSEVFGYEIFFAVPGTKLRIGILWQ